MRRRDLPARAKCAIFAAEMDFSRLRHYRIAGALTLLTLFCTYAGGITLFMHRHTIGGYAVVHSHPYKTAPDTAEHTHTAQQFATIAAVSHFFAPAAVAAICMSLATPDVWETYSDNAAPRAESRPIRRYGLRAPPATLS